MNNDEQWMQVAIEEARKGSGTTLPNPIVGALVVHEGKILAKGFHRFAGGPHAEIVALKKLKRIPPGATLYVTLEPCSTFGETPLCTDAIRRSGLRRVVIGCLDPNPAHRGRGVRILRRYGIDVASGIQKKSCENLNPAFAKYISSGIPFGIAKMAMTLDGKAATHTGDSRWISCRESRKMVQRMRHAADAVLVGAGTVKRDNPRLTIRDKTLRAKRKDWIRIIADSKLVSSPHARVFQPVEGHKTWIATTRHAFRARGQRFASSPVEILTVKSSRQGISLRDLFVQLGKRGICSVLIEGGPTLLASCLKEKVVDRVAFFIAPVIVGGKDAAGPVGGEGAASIRRALNCPNMTVRRVGRDLLAEASIGRESRVYGDC